MTPKEAAEILRQLNEWRRWNGDVDEHGPEMPCPYRIGLAIDVAVKCLEGMA